MSILDMIIPKNMDKGMKEYRAIPGAALLDVRDRAEYRAGHVQGAKNLPVGEIDKIASVIHDKNTPVFVYCLSGHRAGRAVTAMKKMGYTNVRSIGGINTYTGKQVKKQ